MALCPKCIVSGVVQSGGMRPPEDERLRLKFRFTPDADGEVEGVRHVVFEGQVRGGDVFGGGVSAHGELTGNFGIDPAEELRSRAKVETYTRHGAIALVTLSVTGESGRPTFTAHLHAEADDREELALTGTVFMGWPEETASAD